METNPYSKEHFKVIGKDLLQFLTQLLLAVVVGLGVGAFASLFGLLVNWATSFREEHMWLLFLLPLGGVFIVFFYNICHINKYSDKYRGTNRVLEAIYTGDNIPVVMTPLITVSTFITHFFGGSAGREGAALQIGGSL